MIHGDVRYNNHFRHMVLAGVCCGLQHPIEWVTNYDRGIGEAHEMLPEISRFCTLVLMELYSTEYCIEVDEVTIEMVNKWVDDYYKNNKA